MERKMENELDKEAKLKKDAKRLINHALGKNAPEMDRTVKAWLQNKDEAYINQGQPYTKEYRQLIQNEILKDKKNFPVMDQFMKKGLFDKTNEQNGLQEAKNKYKKDYLRERKDLNQDQGQIKFNYEQVKTFYNVSLIDIYLTSPEQYLMKKREDAKATIAHVFKRKFEEKLIFQQLNDTKTLRREKLLLEEKLRTIGIAIELAKQRLEWLIYDTPFTIDDLEDEVKNQKQNGLDQNKLEEQKKLMKNYQIDKKLLIEMQTQSRNARNILKVQMLEVRALKNRTGCESISDFVLLYREFIHIERINDMLTLVNDALLNKKKSQDFFDFIKRIVDFEDEMVRVRQEFATEKIEEKRLVEDKFYNYDEIILQKLKGEDKEEFFKIFRQQKVVFQFIPLWYIPIDLETNKHSGHLRKMLFIDIVQSKIICDYLKSNTIDDLVIMHRHNRKQKEYILFDKEEISYLNRERGIPLESLKTFSETIFLLSKEALMVPEVMFTLAKPSNMVEINFSNQKEEQMTVDAMASIMACIEIYQHKVRRLVFQNCNLNPRSAQLLKIILSSEHKNIVSCNFDNNSFGDLGIDHIVQAMKNNPKGDMRILKIGHNSLSIQASIRISHVLKKRIGYLPPLNLQILKMDNNTIGNIGTETLMNFVKKNDTLKYLDLSYNQIEDRGLLSIAECLLLNEKLQALNILGNKFTNKPILQFSQSIVENKNLNLLILKIGNLECDQQSFLHFINNGYMTSTIVKYLYIVTPLYKNDVIFSSNESFLPKVIYSSEETDPNLNSNILLDFMCQIVEYQLVDGKNTQLVYKFGEKLLKEIIKEKYKLSNIEIMIYMFENIFGPDFILKEQISPFHMFAKYGQLEAISYCLKLGTSPNFKTSIAYEDYPSATALHISAGYNQIELCQHLIKFGVDIDNKDLNGNTAFHYAAIQGSLPLSKLFVEQGGSLIILNKLNMLALHSCIFSDNVPCFKFILQETDRQKQIQYLGKLIEKTIDTKTYKGLTPIMVAVEENSQKIFEFLLEGTIDLKAQDEEGNTVLHRAIMIKDQKKAKQLIKRGADIDIKSYNGESSLMMAARYGLMDVIRVLINNGADINEKNYKGDTLLHLAAKSERADIIGYLLDKGLTTQERNRDGLKPKDLATRKAIKEMLSNDNQRFNAYDESSSPQQKGTRIKKKALQSEAGDTADTWNDYKQLAKDNDAKLLNEELIKYQIDQRDTIGSEFKKKYKQFKTSKMSSTNQGISQIGEDAEDEEEEDDLDEDQHATNGNKNQYSMVDEGEEEEYKDEDQSQNQSKQTQINKYGQGSLGNKRQKNNINPVKRQQQTFESAGFRGTIDDQKSQYKPVMLNNMSLLKSQKNSKDQNSNINRSTLNNNNFDEEEEEEEEDEENNSKIHTNPNSKNNNKGMNQQNHKLQNKQ